MSRRNTTAKTRRPSGGNARRSNLRSDDRVERARRYVDQQRFNEAIKEYRRLVKSHPRDVNLLFQLASAHLRQGDFSAAGRLFRKVCDLAPDQAVVQRTAGQGFQEMGRHREALACFERATAVQPKSVENHVLASGSLERQHRLAEARESIDRALRLDARSPVAMLGAAKLDRRENDLPGAETRLQDLLRLDPPATVAWRAWYELAQVYDRCASFDDAMKALQDGKKLLRSDKSTSKWVQRSWQRQQRLEEMQATLTASHFERWQAQRTEGLGAAPAALIGHPRSGTTMVQQILDAHPGAVGLDERHVMGTIVHNGAIRDRYEDEPEADRLDRLSEAEIRSLRTDYWREIESVVEAPLGDRLLVDKHPELLFYLPSIARVFPDAKVMFLLRDPRDVCLSCFMQPFAMNSTSVDFLSLDQTANHYRRFMDFWLAIREKLQSDWIELRYEDFTDDLATQTQSLSKFLEIPWDERMLEFHAHAQEQEVTTPSYEAVTKPINASAVGRWKNYEKYFEPILAELEPYVKEFGYKSSV